MTETNKDKTLPKTVSEDPPAEFTKDTDLVNLKHASKDEFLKLSAFLKGIKDDG